MCTTTPGFFVEMAASLFAWLALNYNLPDPWLPCDWDYKPESSYPAHNLNFSFFF
jgi:hypothetical protein